MANQINNQDNTFTIKYYRHNSIVNPIQNQEIGNNIKTHTITVQLVHLPLGISNELNARKTKTNKSFHKEMKNSIINPDVSDFTAGLFNLRNSGILMVAESAQVIDQNVLSIDFGSNGSMIDGGHTYEILSSIIRDYNDKKIDCIPEEYVQIEVITGLHKSVIAEITEARNTSQKHQLISLHNQAGKLEWLKKALNRKNSYDNHQINGMGDGVNYTDKIAWYQNAETEDNEKYTLEASEVIKIISTCDIFEYPNALKHPTRSYNGKDKIVEKFGDKPENFEPMHDIVVSICELHDYIISNARVWNKKVQNVFIDKAKYKEKLIFLSGTQLQELSGREKILIPAFAYPMLSALRQLLEVVETDEGNKIVWKYGYNPTVIKQMLEDGLGNQLVQVAHSSMSNLPVINAIMKNSEIYSSMYAVVGEYVRDNS